MKLNDFNLSIDNIISGIDKRLSELGRDGFTTLSDDIAKTASSETSSFAGLEEKLGKGIPAAIDIKNEAFRKEAQLVDQIVKQEKDAFDTLATKISGIVGESGSKIQIPISFVAS